MYLKPPLVGRCIVSMYILAKMGAGTATVGGPDERRNIIGHVRPPKPFGQTIAAPVSLPPCDAHTNGWYSVSVISQGRSSVPCQIRTWSTR
ncbi:unnamed protein product [Mycena citricolor]|uniref:Uncharacterized protein n=1 Tax=Mycena citricolor TaxID=2018698 RepID=A0AAD2Q6T7_9AGAR|nr:unnamed protein product [Mycena citricolor]